MENRPVKIALNMIVKPSDEEAVVLDRCLAEASKHVDGIFITITGENRACELVAAKYDATISKMEWEYDFAKARNFALSQIPQEFTHWTWLDCDDVPRNYDKLKPTIEAHPEIDAFIFNYLYAFDERRNPIVVHGKTRVLKHDGSAKWAGALHEDFDMQRDMRSFFVDGIDVLHLSDEVRVADSTVRNVEVATKEMERNPKDPRSYWNLANSLKMAGQNDEAAALFEQFVRLSQSDDEKFVVHLRMAEIELARNNQLAALDHTRYAIGMRPDFPDAYHMAGHVLFALRRFAEARDMFKRGLVKKPGYHGVIVFNPRDYDYHPMMALAKTYFQLSMPQLAVPLLEACLKITPDDKHLEGTVKNMKKEAEKADRVLEITSRLADEKDMDKVWQELEAIPDELQNHPALCAFRNTRFIKKESSGKDLVIYCSFTEEEWSPETAVTKGIGGSEEAVIHLSKRLVARGWNVTVYNNCGYKTRVFDGVTYKPFWTWNPRDKQDVTVIWRHPKTLDYEINCDRIFLDMHDVIQPGEFTEARLEKLAGIFVKSQAHRRLFPHVPDEKFIVVPNGIVWEDMQGETERDPMLMINTSSPDRSLSALVDMFEEVKKRVPEAKLKWCYGWRGWDYAYAGDTEKKVWKDRLKAKMALLGIEDMGRISHGEVAKLYRKANVFAYPTCFYEIDCISARKAQAAGAVPVVTDFAALDETVKFGDKVLTDPARENWGKPYQYDYALMDETARQKWIDAVVHRLQNPLPETGREAMREWTKQFDWENIAEKWDNTLKV